MKASWQPVRPTTAGVLAGAALVGAALAGCTSLPSRSHDYNPLGWPAAVLGFVGQVSVDTGIPVLRDAGRVLIGGGELADAPALLVEGVVTVDPLAVVAAGQHAIAGSGQTLKAAYNFPLFAAPALQLDPTGGLFAMQQVAHAAASAPPPPRGARGGGGH